MTKIHFIIPIAISESKDKFPFIDGIDFEQLDNMSRTIYVNSYKEAVKDAKILSKKFQQDFAVVEIKQIIKA